MNKGTLKYRVNHQLPDLGRVDLDLDFSPMLPRFSPILPNSRLPKQNQTDSGIAKIKVNPNRGSGR